MHFSFPKMDFFKFLAPSEGQKFDVSKVWLVGCLNFCLKVTRRYKVKKVENIAYTLINIQETVNFGPFQKKCGKFTDFGIFLEVGTKFHTYFTLYLLVTLRQKFRHPTRHTLGPPIFFFIKKIFGPQNFLALNFFNP